MNLFKWLSSVHTSRNSKYFSLIRDENWPSYRSRAPLMYGSLMMDCIPKMYQVKKKNRGTITERLKYNYCIKIA
jgi:hypothetical protein